MTTNRVSAPVVRSVGMNLLLVRNDGHAVSAGVPVLTTAGLMELCTLVVGGDTWTLHLAVVMGERIVMVVSSTSPAAVPLKHLDWSVTPRDSQPVAAGEVGAVIKACAFALTAIGGDRSLDARTT